MSDLELNKVAAAVLVAGLVAMAAGSAAKGLYTTDEGSDKRGFEVEVADASTGGAKKVEEVIDVAALMQAADILLRNLEAR